MQFTEDPKQLDQLFFALADSTRRAMVDRLSSGPASVSELARPHHMALPSVVKHLAVLEAGGLVVSQKAGRVRTYRIALGALGAMEAWAAERKARWNAQFDGLEAYLQARQAEGEAK
jgi:DNA-binding transcriptional ArsR family regulator